MKNNNPALKNSAESKSGDDLDAYRTRLIKVVGIIGVVIGFAILIAFWFWVFKQLYKV